ncbi:ribosome silencing factor [Diaphorobacter sp. C33]|uniref:Ribosomal silencing factor RsfS n=1 Tax=Diaphorobacter nitroreducens TaxID=164759 RepID=A0AAX1WY33_9BURK|nr:ribosome silencing factor [Diaphorobacter sp. C33]ROR48199.1 ribosome-associated protein [Diaphorobacter nitroreducens]WKK90732.1 ribosome silencing factor [Diaphorobacter sp. C33]
MTTSSKSETAAKKDVTKLQRAIVDGLEDVKAQDIQVFNTEHLSPLFERVVVATGSSNRQTKALAASVRDAVRKAGFPKPRSEGEDNGEWIIVDCGQAVVHVMQPAIRQYYRLEEIWGEKPVRLKLGAAKPRKIMASEGDDEAPARKPAAKKAAAKPATKSATGKKPAKAAAPAAAKPAAKSAVKPASKPAAKLASKAQKAPVKAASKPGAKKTTAKPVAAKKPAVKNAVKTVVVNKPVAKKAPAKAAATTTARKPVAKSTGKAVAKKAPARKKA